MQSAIDAPKSKSISIAFFSLKIMLIGFFFVQEVIHHHQSICEVQYDQLTASYSIFFLVSIVFDAFFMLYFCFTRTFSRLEYYVFYIIHLIFAIFSFITLTQTGSIQVCFLRHQFLGTCIFIQIMFLVTSLMLMWSNLYFGLKYAHMGSNIIWAFMWFTQSPNNETIPTLICIIHIMLSIVNLGSLIASKFMKKNETTASCWRYIFMFSIFFMLLCYILIYISSVDRYSIFTSTYKIVGWVEVIPPILLLIFLNTQFGDVRQKMMKKDANVFLKARENQNFIADDIY